MEVNRREVLITMGGAVLGRFFRAEADQMVDLQAPTPTLRLAALPTRRIRPDGTHFLVYTKFTDDGPLPMVWHAETPEEIEEATAFYNACRHYDGVPGVVQPPTSLGGKMARWLKDLLEPDPRRRSAEEQQLLQDILDNRDDNAPLLRYADWLTARGSPQGEFIRLDVALEDLSEDDPQYQQVSDRWRDLYAEFGETFVAPLQRIGVFPVSCGELCPYLFMDRGVVNKAEIERSGILPEHLDDLFALAPLLTDLDLNFEGMRLGEIVGHPRMSQIRTLKAGSESPIGAECMRALAESPHCANLRDLNLSHARFRAGGGLWLSQAPFLPKLTALNVRECLIGAYAFRKLTERDCFEALQSLDVSGNRLDANSMAQLAGCRSMQRLEELDLSGNPQIADGLPRLAEAAFASTLRQLTVANVPLGADHISEFARRRYERLELLDFSLCKLTDESVLPLLESECFRNLKFVDICYNEFTADIGALLARVPFHRLEILTLNHTPLKDRGLAALLESPHLQSLQILNIVDCEIGPEGVHTLVDAAALPALEKLRFGKNKIGLEGARLLARADRFKLTELWVDPESVGQQGKQILRERYGEDVYFT